MSEYGPRYWTYVEEKWTWKEPDLDVIIKIFLACNSPECVTLRTAEEKEERGGGIRV
jgi:hypothetical protein